MENQLSKTKRNKLNKGYVHVYLSPLVMDKKGEFSSLFDNLKAKGFRQTRVDGVIKNLSDELILIKTNKHTIEVVVDRFSLHKKDFNNKIFFENS